jgi:hypothetical protein
MSFEKRIVLRFLRTPEPNRLLLKLQEASKACGPIKASGRIDSPATRSSAGFAMLTGCIDLDSQEGDAIQQFTKSADNSAPIRFPYCAWICLDSWASFDLPLA